MGKKGYKGLVVWQKAKDLAVDVYKLTREPELSRDVSLRDQIRRSAISIPSNVAEGDERDTDKEAVRFFYMAKGSLAELRTQLQICFEIGNIKKDRYETAELRCEELGRMLGSLIKVRSTRSKPLAND